MLALAGLYTLAIHAVLMLALSPLLTGALRVLRARAHGRVGPPLLQPYRDLLRQLRKQPVLAENASILLEAAPTAVVAATVVAALLVPSFALGMASAPLADLIVLAALLGTGRVALALAGWDSGAAFGGMGATRAMLFAAFAEPALLLVVFVLALLTGTTNLDAAAALLREGQLGLRVSLALALASLCLVAIAENGRVPVDNPASHLELTMVHEATALEYSGRHLALVEYAAGLRLLLWMTLIGTIFMPFGLAPPGVYPLAWLAGALAWLAKLAVLGLGLTVMEALTAKMRVFRVPEFLGVAILLAFLAVVFLFVSQGFA